MPNATTSWIALLRGINVGGRNRLPMAELRELFERAGCLEVRTYIQSGNVVLATGDGTARAELAERLAAAVEAAKGFRPAVVLLTLDELAAAMEGNPFPKATAEPNRLHLWFLADEPDDVDFDALDSLRTPSERFELSGRILYLHAPDGIGRSKLAARVERALGVEATARNWRTVDTLHEMAAESGGSAGSGG